MLTLFSAAGHAQYITGPVASGAGGAGRASTEDGEQFIHNPAALVDASQGSSSLFYSTGSDMPGEQDQYYGATLTDNSPGLLFSGAYLYVHRIRMFQGLPSVTEDYHQFSLGRYVWRHISVGASITYLRSVLGGSGGVNGAGDAYVQWNGHVGVLYNPFPNLGLAFVSYNAFGRQENIPMEIQEVNKIAFGSTYILMDSFHLRGDVSEIQVDNPKHLNEYQLGFESRVEPMLWARVGYDRDEYFNLTYWTAGLTFNGPKLKADYYFRDDVAAGGIYMQGVDLRLPF